MKSIRHFGGNVITLYNFSKENGWAEFSLSKFYQIDLKNKCRTPLELFINLAENKVYLLKLIIFYMIEPFKNEFSISFFISLKMFHVSSQNMLIESMEYYIFPYDTWF